jgi:hypothetical protein
MRRSLPLAVLVVVIAAGALIAVINLFSLSLQTGEVYPAYSTFLPEPTGARAYYNALASMPGMRVRRNLAPLTALPGRGRTLVFLGAEIGPDPKTTLDLLDDFVRQGGRIVITFAPTRHNAWEDLLLGDTAMLPQPGNTAEPAPGDTAEAKKHPGPKSTDKSELADISERWGFGYGFAPLAGGTDGGAAGDTAERVGDGATPPGSLSWHSTLYFTEPAPEWNVIYQRGQWPVLMERPLGRGTLVLASDSYFTSNEALRKEARPALLAWLVGGSGEVIFDETHLGVSEGEGVMVLIRRYRLEWLLAALGLVIGLYAWKNAASLAPKRDFAASATAARLGRDSSEGLTNLLQRSVAPDRVLMTGYEQWKRAAGRGLTVPARKMKKIEAVMAGRSEGKVPPDQAVAAYREVARILKEQG